MDLKYRDLKTKIASYQKLIVAYSGGVDSTFLLKVAHDVLGKNAMGVSFKTPYMPKNDVDEALFLAKHIGVACEIIEAPWNESLRTNPKNRCYVCKQTLFSTLADYAKAHGFAYVADGSNTDDLNEYRPGRRALAELGIQTPLVEARLCKEEIRSLSYALDLPTWDKPSKACLLTRFAYNTKIGEEALALVDAAEAYLTQMGYGDMRVRFEHQSARIELPQNAKIAFLNDARVETMCHDLKALGFLHVTLDLESFRHDSIAESIHLGDTYGNA